MGSMLDPIGFKGLKGTQRLIFIMLYVTCNGLLARTSQNSSQGLDL